MPVLGPGIFFRIHLFNAAQLPGQVSRVSIGSENLAHLQSIENKCKRVEEKSSIAAGKPSRSKKAKTEVGAPSTGLDAVIYSFRLFQRESKLSLT